LSVASEPVVEASLGLGGNIGDVAGSFIHALRSLVDAPDVKLRRASSIYRTPPWGKLDQPSFLNMAVLVETDLPSRALLALCLEIEQKMGRRRLERWGPRTLDIDILTYGDATIDEPDLKIPHPRTTERAFVLAPLAEIAPRLRIADQEVAQWLALVDRAGVEVEPAATARVRSALGLDAEGR
jgi:2-amino-4-hydroxy-6-hydroxymethyldihydropteridine diphosphokinase